MKKSIKKYQTRKIGLINHTDWSNLFLCQNADKPCRIAVISDYLFNILSSYFNRNSVGCIYIRVRGRGEKVAENDLIPDRLSIVFNLPVFRVSEVKID